jgi:hypothetical protein
MREKPKKTSFGFATVVSEFILGGLAILSLLCVTAVLYVVLNSETERMYKQSKEGQAILEVYSGLCWVTN